MSNRDHVRFDISKRHAYHVSYTLGYQEERNMGPLTGGGGGGSPKSHVDFKK